MDIPSIVILLNETKVKIEKTKISKKKKQEILENLNSIEKDVKSSKNQDISFSDYIGIVSPIMNIIEVVLKMAL